MLRQRQRVRSLLLQAPPIQVLGCVERLVVGAAAADEREVQAGHAALLEHGEVRVVRHAVVDRRPERARHRMRRDRGELAHEPTVPPARLEQDRRAAVAARLEVEHQPHRLHPRVPLRERVRAVEPPLLPVGEDQQHVGPHGPLEQSRDLEQRRDGRRVVRGARTTESRVVVTEQEHGAFATGAGKARAHVDLLVGPGLAPQEVPVSTPERPLPALQLDLESRALEFFHQVRAHLGVGLRGRLVRPRGDHADVLHRALGREPSDVGGHGGRRLCAVGRQRDQRDQPGESGSTSAGVHGLASGTVGRAARAAEATRSPAASQARHPPSLRVAVSPG